MKDINIIFGWFLLLFGLGLIFSVLLYSYNVFTAKTDLPEFFKIDEQVLTLEQEKNEIALTQEAVGDENKFSSSPLADARVGDEMQKIIGEQLKDFLPVDNFSNIFNLIVWSIFAGILIFAGAQISGIGIKLIKTNKD
jgi:hypothetical protein